MKLKKFNEIFGQSKEYSEYLKSKSDPIEIIKDSLYDLNSFATNICYRYVIDSKENPINLEIKKDEIFKILYACKISYGVKFTETNFSKIADNFHTIKISIEEMINRISDELTLKENKYHQRVSSNSICHEFLITFLSEEIDKKELLQVYNNYKLSTDKEYINGLSFIKKWFRGKGIQIDNYINTLATFNDSDDNLILIGVMFGDEFEIHQVAEYNKTTKKFTVYKDGLEDALDDAPRHLKTKNPT